MMSQGFRKKGSSLPKNQASRLSGGPATPFFNKHFRYLPLICRRTGVDFYKTQKAS